MVETKAISFNKRDLETTHNTYSDPVTVEKEVSSNSTMLCHDQENGIIYNEARNFTGQLTDDAPKPFSVRETTLKIRYC